MKKTRILALILTIVMLFQVTPFTMVSAADYKEQKVALTVDDVVLNRYFPESGWAEPDTDFTPNLNLIVDGTTDTYAYSGVWGNPTDVLVKDNFKFQLVVDLGVEKNLSRVGFHVGAENYGNGWQFAAPLHPEILLLDI